MAHCSAAPYLVLTESEVEKISCPRGCGVAGLAGRVCILDKLVLTSLYATSPRIEPTRRSRRRRSTYRPLTSKTRYVHRADAIDRMHHGSSILWTLECLLSSILVRPSRLPHQPGTISRGSLGFHDRLPAERGPGTGLKLGHQGYQEEEEEEEEFIRIQWIL